MVRNSVCERKLLGIRFVFVPLLSNYCYELPFGREIVIEA